MKSDNIESIRILLVEDSPTEAALIKAVLSDESDIDVSITDASSLHQAFDLLGNNNFEVILLDLTLPDSRGIETFQRMYDKTKDIPIVILSAVDSKEVALNAVRNGAQDYIVKENLENVQLVLSLRYAIERKQVELQLKEAMEIKSKFISIASHELRAPLAAIEQGIDLILDGIVGTITKEQQKYLELAKRNIERLTRLVNDVLDIQKLRAGKMQFNFQQNDINHIALDVHKTMSPLAKNQGLELLLNLENNLPQIECDADRITQVLTNLINNALKFTSSGNITIYTASDDDGIKISVIDTGIGIKAEDLPKVFKEFEQLEDGVKKGGGTGLGLAITKDIVEQHGGRIEVNSEYGKGTTFQFVLPVNKTAVKV